MISLKNNKGFTLPEVIVATGIIVFGVVGGLTLITFALNSVQFARNRSVAIASLQEGMEIVRSMRDDNWHADRPWDDYISGRNLSGGCANFTSYTVDATVYHNLPSGPLNTQSVIDCVASDLNSSSALLYITSQGRFTHDSSGDAVSSNLRRIIEVIPDPLGCDETTPCTSLMIVGRVLFDSGPNTRELSVSDRLWDWR